MGHWPNSRLGQAKEDVDNWGEQILESPARFPAPGSHRSPSWWGSAQLNPDRHTGLFNPHDPYCKVSGVRQEVDGFHNHMTTERIEGIMPLHYPSKGIQLCVRSSVPAAVQCL